MRKILIATVLLMVAMLFASCTTSKKSSARYLFLYKDKEGVIHWMDNATFDEVTLKRYGK